MCMGTTTTYAPPSSYNVEDEDTILTESEKDGRAAEERFGRQDALRRIVASEGGRGSEKTGAGRAANPGRSGGFGTDKSTGGNTPGGSGGQGFA